jgi:transcriptional regulator with XRE-family HTH domain
MNRELFIQDLLLRLQSLKLSQNQLGKDIGISQSGINYYISGKHNPSADVFLRICKRLGLNPNKYFRQEDSWADIFKKHSLEGAGISVLEYLCKNYYAPSGK